MQILMLSKALVVGAYQKKAEELARLPGVELTVAAPPLWREPGLGPQVLERRFTQGYALEALPISFNGRHHVHFYPTIERLVARLRPDVFHIDEESFNLATFLAMRAGLRHGARCCFYNWATIDRWYPPPFAFFERYAFRHAAHAIVGAEDAATIIRRHGYGGPISVLPQFGVDPALFAPTTDHRPPTTDHRPPTTARREPTEPTIVSRQSSGVGRWSSFRSGLPGPAGAAEGRARPGRGAAAAAAACAAAAGGRGRAAAADPGARR